MGYSELANWDGSLARRLAVEKAKSAETVRKPLPQLVNVSAGGSNAQASSSKLQLQDIRSEIKTDVDIESIGHAKTTANDREYGGGSPSSRVTSGMPSKSELIPALGKQPLLDSPNETLAPIAGSDRKPVFLNAAHELPSGGTDAYLTLASSSAPTRECPSGSDTGHKRAISKRVDDGSLASTFLNYYAETAGWISSNSSSSQITKNLVTVKPRPSRNNQTRPGPLSKMLKREAQIDHATPSTSNTSVPPKQRKKVVFDCVLITRPPRKNISSSQSISSETSAHGETSRSRSGEIRSQEAGHKKLRTYSKHRFKRKIATSAADQTDAEDGPCNLSVGSISDLDAEGSGSKCLPIMISSDSEGAHDDERLASAVKEQTVVDHSSSKSVTPVKRSVDLPRPEAERSSNVQTEILSACQAGPFPSASSNTNETSFEYVEGLEINEPIATEALPRSGQSAGDKPTTSIHISDDFAGPRSTTAEEMKSTSIIAPTDGSAESSSETPATIEPVSLAASPIYMPSPDPSINSSVTLVQTDDMPSDAKQKKRKDGRKFILSNTVVPDVFDDGIDEDDLCHQCSSRNVYAKMKCTKVKDSEACPLWYCHLCVVKCYLNIAFDPFAESFHCPRCTETCSCRKCCKRREVPYKPPNRKSWRRLGVDLLLSEQATQRRLLYGDPSGPPKISRMAGIPGEDEEDDDDDDDNVGVSSSSKHPPVLDKIKPSERVFIGSWQPSWGDPPKSFRHADINSIDLDVHAASGNGKGKAKMVDAQYSKLFIGAPPGRRAPQESRQPQVEPVKTRTPRKPPPGAVDVRTGASSKPLKTAKTSERKPGKRKRKPSQKAIEAAASAVAFAGDEDEGLDQNGAPNKKRSRTRTQSDPFAPFYVSNSATPSYEDYTIPEPDSSSSPPKQGNIFLGGESFNYDWSQVANLYKPYSYVPPQPPPISGVFSSNLEPTITTEYTYSTTYSLPFSSSVSYSQAVGDSSTPLPFKRNSLAAKNANVGLFTMCAADMLVDPLTSFTGVIDPALLDTDGSPRDGALGALSSTDIERAVRSALTALAISRAMQSVP